MKPQFCFSSNIKRQLYLPPDYSKHLPFFPPNITLPYAYPSPLQQPQNTVVTFPLTLPVHKSLPATSLFHTSHTQRLSSSTFAPFTSTTVRHYLSCLLSSIMSYLTFSNIFPLRFLPVISHFFPLPFPPFPHTPSPSPQTIP